MTPIDCERFHPKNSAERDRMVQATLKLPHVDVGQFRVCAMSGARVWIQSRSGEGMEAPAADLEATVAKFWNDTF